MPFIKASLALVAMAILSANSQITYTIDPNNVPLPTRQSWCLAQTSSCPLLCLQNMNQSDASTSANDCDPDTLVYNCQCSNGMTPNLNNYSQTIPFFECQEYGNECVAACGDGNTPCQSACRDDHPCGAQSPTRINTTSISTMAATATGGASGSSPTVFNGLGGTSSSSTKKSGSHAALEIGRSYGLAVVFAGLFAGFAFIM